MKISIIIPAHNEEKRIRRTLEEYSEFFIRLKKQKAINNFEIVVVVNACKDNTIEVVKKQKQKHKEIKYLNFKEGGKGFAVTEGFKYSVKGKSEVIGFVDADMATSPDEFYKLIENLNGFDGVIASRHKSQSIVNGKSVIGILKSHIFNIVVRLLFFLPYQDTQCGAKIFKKEVIKKIINSLEATEWAFDVELLYKIHKEGFKIKEVSTIWEEQAGSKLDLIRVSIRMFFSVVRLRLINSEFKGIVNIYDKLPNWIKVHHKIRRKK